MNVLKKKIELSSEKIDSRQFSIRAVVDVMRKSSKAFKRADKAQQAMLAAVSIYNSPIITYKTETCISLICTAWTYLLQAYCETQGIEIRQPDTSNKKRKYKRSDEGQYLIIPLRELADKARGFIDEAEIQNIHLVSGVRNRIQHSADNSIDDLLAPNLQANIMNFRKALLSFTDQRIDIADKLNLSLQFTELSIMQTREVFTSARVDHQLKTFIMEFETGLSEEILKDIGYSAKIKFNLENKGRGKDALAVNVVGFGEDIPKNATIIANKEVEKPKYKPKAIVEMMQKEGWTDFSMTIHTSLWRDIVPNARTEKTGYGTNVPGGGWFWYKKWIDEVVRPYCKEKLLNKSVNL